MSILIFSEHGKYTTKLTLEEARTSPDCANKTVVVTSVLTEAQSNILDAWPSDRALKVEKGGSIANSTSFTINGPFEAGLCQVFTGGGSLTFGSNSISEIYPEWFGAKSDNITDCTSAFNIAFNKGIPVRLSTGTYLANAVHTTGYLVLQGSGIKSTFIKSYTSGGYAFLEQNNIGDWSTHATINDVTFLGDSNPPTVGGRNGFGFGNPITYNVNDELAGRTEFNRVGFTYCDKGVHKPYGNIGNTFNKCAWAANNFGVYAEDDAAHIMSAGYDTYNGGEINGSFYAGVYINSLNFESGQTIFNGTVIEGNAGYGIYIAGYSLSYVAVKINSVHFENNATAGTVTIDGATGVPFDIFMKNTRYAVIDGCGEYTLHLIDSNVYETNPTLYESTTSLDSDSILVTSRVNTINTSNVTQRYVESYGSGGANGGSSSDILITKPRNLITRGYTKIAGNDYSNAGMYFFNGNAGVNAESRADGILFDSCARLTVPNGYTLLDDTGYGLISYTSGKWYVWSADIKLESGSAPIIYAGGAATFFGNISPAIVTDKWVTVGGITKAVITSTATFPYVVNNTGGDVVLLFSAVQVIEFTTQSDAIKYFNAGLYQPTIKLPRTSFATIAPVSGVWRVGDRVVNNTPVVGQPKAWACTVAGTPGTWVSEGNL